MRVDDTGAFLSSNVIGDPRLDGFYDVSVDELGTIFAIGGRALALESAAWLVVQAPDGTMTETLLPGSLAFGLARKPDGGFVVVGEDAILTHLDALVNPVQALTVGTAPLQKRTLRDVLIPSNGGLLVVGSQHIGVGTTRPLAICTDP